MEEFDKYIEEIVKACSPQLASKEVMDRMLERDTERAMYNQLSSILVHVAEEAQADYRQKIVSAWTRALEPFTQGVIEKLTPKPDMATRVARVAHPYPQAQPQNPIPSTPLPITTIDNGVATLWTPTRNLKIKGDKMQGKTIITVVLDETGSMMPRRDMTISGFNEFMESQKDKALGDCSVNLIQFNSNKGAVTVYKDKPIADVPEMTHNDYSPDANTPLYDALAQGILDTRHEYEKANAVLSRLVGKKTTAATPMVIVLVMTDGEENSSRQYNREQIFKMVNERRAKGWSFVFMGADMDAWAQASVMAFAAANTRQFHGAQLAQNWGLTAQALTNNRVSYTAAMANNNLNAIKTTLNTAASNFYGTGVTQDQLLNVKLKAKKNASSSHKL